MSIITVQSLKCSTTYYFEPTEQKWESYYCKVYAVLFIYVQRQKLCCGHPPSLRLGVKI